ncbi:SOS response-associated peptidase [Bartonella sp. M0177]|uniref:SOS response-associated peptidase n=1 Tax=Bartonella sp. M0177 TaxID=2750940 RepID=UPI0018DD48D0|nr:SOS response-associated peptidase [Bartonella sp. M0177]MBI0003225.1 SOS response-associated peptidase [Bartonella sp. M0177]
MCGRYELDASKSEVANAFDAWIEEDFPKRYNIAPTQPILVIKAPEAYRDTLSNKPKHDALLVRWGFIPGWTKNPDQWPLTFNIRSETVAVKKSFTNALRHHRVIIPATGFYEWKKQSRGRSQPYHAALDDHSIIGFAGLMETWSGSEGSQIDTAAILTTEAKSSLAEIHHRMPVIVRREDIDRWLDCRNFRPADVMDILKNTPAEQLQVFPVSDKINNAAYSGSDVKDRINPVEDSGDKAQQQNSEDQKQGKSPKNKDQFDLF